MAGVRVIQRRLTLALLGLMLLVASALKGYELATSSVAETGFLTSRWFLIGQVEWELGLGLWLLSGFYPRAARMVALTCFIAFLGESLHQGLSGQTSCGCFGKVSVNPWLTLGLDSAAIIALVRCGSVSLRSTASAPPLIRVGICVALFAMLGLTGAWIMARHAPVGITDEGDIPNDSRLVLLEPTGWVGRRFPLLRHIDMGKQLAEGEWLVLLYHHNCPVCRRAIKEYERFARSGTSQAVVPRVALIEVPTHGDVAPGTLPAGRACSLGRRSEARDWFVKTPVAIRLKDGRSVAVTGNPRELLDVALHFASPE